ncbi:hypothetical protein WN51_02528 [Melipona quadrifasciata]|uniref:Uncharacterized protein n=1 Tax=Melipona quadrifasciata TaxID=166423 RepID=A0A0N0BDP4_9HYME|nr:hypothetical protein WN51_02528 [Melipona quadrifasciata]
MPRIDEIEPAEKRQFALRRQCLWRDITGKLVEPVKLRVSIDPQKQHALNPPTWKVAPSREQVHQEKNRASSQIERLLPESDYRSCRGFNLATIPTATSISLKLEYDVIVVDVAHHLLHRCFYDRDVRVFQELRNSCTLYFFSDNLSGCGFLYAEPEPEAEAVSVQQGFYSISLHFANYWEPPTVGSDAFMKQ